MTCWRNAILPTNLFPAIAAALLLLLQGELPAGAQSSGQVPQAKKEKEQGPKTSAPGAGAPGKPKKPASAGEKPAREKTAAKPAQDPAAKSLDDELLGELSDGLFGPVEDELFRQGVQKPKRPAGLPKPKGTSPAGGAEAGPKEPSPGEDLPELVQPEGEDIGPQDNPLASISRQMQQVQRLLASRQLDRQTQQMQQEIVRRLEKLLQQARRSSSSSGGAGQRQQQTASRASSQRNQVRLPAGSQPAGGHSRGKPQGEQAARRPNPQAEQTQEKGPRTPKPKEKESNLVQDLIKRIWGHLPPRMRQQMLQSASDRFLPQYQLEIEEYFKRVSRARTEEP